MTFAQTWSEAYLGATTRQDDIDAIVQNTRIGVRERAAVEHSAYADETGHDDVWRHAKAASRTNYGLAASKPATEATGRVDGARYLETDTGLIKYWNATTEAWVTEGSIEHADLTTTYATGTVTVTNASAVVTGSGTAFTDNVATTDVFKGPDGEYYGITSVDSSVQITLDRVYDGVTAAGGSYTIYLDGHPQYIEKSGGTVDGAVTINAALTMGAAVAMGDNKVTGLAAATANGDAVRYEQLVGVFAKCKIGTYTGDGEATQAITGVGFQPEYVILWKQASGIYIRHKTNQDTTYAKNSNGGYFEDEIISLDADGFTVGDGTGGGETMNTDTATYTYLAFRYSA